MVKAEILFGLKEYRRAWSDQRIHTTIKESTSVDIVFKALTCSVTIQSTSREMIAEYIHIIWEIFAFYDGYFYKPLQYSIDGIENDPMSLVTIKMYDTDSKWIDAATLLGRNHRSLEPDIIIKYYKLRSMDRNEGSMNRSMINSYFYLVSSSYKEINIEHRLVLMMHICDGFVREYLNGSKTGSADNVKKIIRLIGKKRYKEGAQLLDIQENAALNAIGYTRNELTHFTYEDDKLSLGSFVSNPDTETDQMVYLYSFYVLESAFRIALLCAIGYNVEDDVKAYLMEDLLDWIKITKNLSENCSIPVNALKQTVQRMMNNNGANGKSV